MKGNFHYYFIESSNGELVLLTNEKKVIEKDIYGTSKTESYTYETKRHIGVLKYAFRDSKELYPSIEKTILERESLIDITTEYHNRVCKDGDCLKYKSKIQGLKGNWGFMLGVNSVNPQYSSETYKVFTHKHTIKPIFEAYDAPSINGYVDFHLQKFMTNLSFQISAGILFYNGVWEENAEEVVGTFYNKIEFKGIGKQFAYSMKYTFSQKYISPYIKLGLHAWGISGENYRTFTSNYEHIENEEAKIKAGIGDFGATYGIGCYVRIKTFNRIFFEYNNQNSSPVFQIGMEF